MRGNVDKYEAAHAAVTTRNPLVAATRRLGDTLPTYDA